MTELTHFIDGQHVSGVSGRTKDVYNPVRGEVTAQVPLASADEVRTAVDSAERAFGEWSRLNPQRRARILLKWVDLIQANRDELAETLSNEHGKISSDALGDIQRGVEVAECGAGAPHMLRG